MSEVQSLTDQNFDQHVLKNESAVLVDFWAPWCGPCVRMNPILIGIAKEFEGRLSVMKLDVQDHPMTPATYGVVSIPTFILFYKGEKRAERKGFADAETFSEWLNEHLP